MTSRECGDRPAGQYAMALSSVTLRLVVGIRSFLDIAAPAADAPRAARRHNLWRLVVALGSLCRGRR